MDKIIVVVFQAEQQAYEGSRALHELHRDGSITLFADAVIGKGDSGTVSVRQKPEVGFEGTLYGFLTGSIIGLLGGPVGVALGAGTGTIVGTALDAARAGVGDDFLHEVSEYLVPKTAAVIAEVDEEWQIPLDSRMEAIGGRVFRRSRIDIEDAWYEREMTAIRAELDALEAERQKASAERKAKLDAKIEGAKRRLRDTEHKVEVRIASLKREGEAKVESLKKQMEGASQERKAKLEQRLAEVRADHNERAAKLQKAWELAKSALTV